MMNRNAFMAAAVLTLVTAIGSAQTTAPDNSKANSDSVNSTSKTSTADSSKSDSTDIALTQQIRKSIMAYG